MMSDQLEHLLDGHPKEGASHIIVTCAKTQQLPHSTTGVIGECTERVDRVMALTTELG
jgi:hypothetical protein